MSLNGYKAPKGGGNGGNRVEQPTIEPGGYPARLAQLIDMGVQPQRAYKGEDKPPAHEVMFTYELLDVFMVDEDGNELEDKPRWISETFPFRNLEQDLAKSTKRYRALDPKDDYNGDFTQLVTLPCTVTIVHGENKKNPERPYENIGNVSTMRPRDAANAPELKNTPRVFTLDEPDMEVFNAFPEWIQAKIKSNLEFKGSALEKALSEPRKGTDTKAKADPKGNPSKASEEAPSTTDDEAEEGWA